MRRFLFDSGPFNDFISRQGSTYARAMARVQFGDRLGICPPFLGEFLGGVLGGSSIEKNLKLFRRIVPLFRMWPYDRKAAEEYAQLRAYLKRIGRRIQVIDMQIAAIAIAMGNTTVVTKDSDFKAIPGLDLVDWSEPDS